MMGRCDEVDDDQLLELGQSLGKEACKIVKLDDGLTLRQKREVEKLVLEYHFHICQEQQA